jgi:hypothetical protein
VREPLAEPISDGHGGQMTERVAEIHWTGGSPPDAFYDEFVFRTRLPDTPGATIQFPVVQESRRREPLDRGARRRAGCGRPAQARARPRPHQLTPGSGGDADHARTDLRRRVMSRILLALLVWLVAPPACAHAVLHGTAADSDIAEAPEEVACASTSRSCPSWSGCSTHPGPRWRPMPRHVIDRSSCRCRHGGRQLNSDPAGDLDGFAPRRRLLSLCARCPSMLPRRRRSRRPTGAVRRRCTARPSSP